MHRWRDLTEVPQGLGPSVVTIGVFDGVHRGHQAVIGRVVELAREHGALAVVMTFDPHPAAVVRPDAVTPLLTPLEQRMETFERYGVDGAVVLRFTPERSRQPAEEFVREVAGALRPTGIVVGANFRFGYKATGDVALLDRLGADLGFGVEGLPLTGPHDGSDGSDGGSPGSQPWSSTAVRECLAAGDVAGARAILGRPFRIDGVVVRGDRRGRQLGFPTANVPADPALAVPADGVYAGWLVRLDEPGPGAPIELPAAISVGTKPQFGPHERVVEAYVLDRDDLELYDAAVGIEFVDRVRGQQVFDSVEALVAQMGRDTERVRTVLDRERPADRAPGAP